VGGARIFCCVGADPTAYGGINWACPWHIPTWAAAGGRAEGTGATPSPAPLLVPPMSDEVNKVAVN